MVLNMNTSTRTLNVSINGATLSEDGVRYQTDGDTALSSLVFNNLGNSFSTSIAGRTLQVFVISGVPGDYNRDGAVDAADYVVWRKAQGTTTQLPNDNGIGGIVGLAQYNLWRSSFGNPGGGAGAGSQVGGAAVPEPAPALLGILAVAWLLTVRLRANLATPMSPSWCVDAIHRLMRHCVCDTIRSNPT
jgi:hypothetical protein